MCKLIVLIILSKVTAQDLQISMPHEPLQGEDIYAAAQHVESKRPAETV